MADPRTRLLDVPPDYDELLARAAELPWAVKPDWQGVGGRLVGWPIQLAAWLRFPPAVKYMTVYTTILFGWIYLRVGRQGPPTDGTRAHEAVHDWQGDRYFAHGLRVSLDPRGVNLPWLRTKVSWRGHTEAMAYALNVVRGELTTTEAVQRLTKPAYATGLTRGLAFDLVAAYVTKLRRECRGVPLPEK